MHKLRLRGRSIPHGWCIPCARAVQQRAGRAKRGAEVTPQTTRTTCNRSSGEVINAASRHNEDNYTATTTSEKKKKKRCSPNAKATTTSEATTADIALLSPSASKTS